MSEPHGAARSRAHALGSGVTYRSCPRCTSRSSRETLADTIWVLAAATAAFSSTLSSCDRLAGLLGHLFCHAGSTLDDASNGLQPLRVLGLRWTCLLSACSGPCWNTLRIFLGLDGSIRSKLLEIILVDVHTTRVSVEWLHCGCESWHSMMQTLQAQSNSHPQTWQFELLLHTLLNVTTSVLHGTTHVYQHHVGLHACLAWELSCPCTSQNMLFGSCVSLDFATFLLCDFWR